MVNSMTSSKRAIAFGHWKCSLWPQLQGEPNENTPITNANLQEGLTDNEYSRSITMNSIPEQILDSLSIATYAKDHQGNVVYANEEGLKLMKKRGLDGPSPNQREVGPNDGEASEANLYQLPLCSKDGAKVGICYVALPSELKLERLSPIFTSSGHRRSRFSELCIDDDSSTQTFKTTTTCESTSDGPSRRPSKKRVFDSLPVDLNLEDPIMEESDCQSLISNMPIGFCKNEVVRDAVGVPVDYVFKEANANFEAMTGLEREKILNKKLSEVFEPSEAALWIKNFCQVVVDHKPWVFEQYSEMLGRWYSGTCSWAGKDCFTVLFLDITHQVNARQALQEGEEKYRTLFEAMEQGVVYQDRSGQIISANPSACRLLGLTIEQLTGRTSVDPRWKPIHEDGSEFPGEDHPGMIALKTGKSVIGVLMGVFHPQHGAHRWLSIDSIPRFREGENVPYQSFTVFTDITERKEFESALQEAKLRAEAADKLKSEFLTNMSHEVRTPLNGILGNLQLVLLDGLNEESRAENIKCLRAAEISGQLLLSIMQDIIDISKLEAGLVTVISAPLCLSSVFTKVAGICQGLIAQKKASVDVKWEIDNVISTKILGDKFRLMQVLQNLVSNAVKFTGNGGRIRIRARLQDEDKQCITFSVTDNGTGIPREFLENLFVAFRQADASDTRKHGGVGLGLAISKRLVEMMGGKLTFTTSTAVSSSGSTFAFSLPYKPFCGERKYSDEFVPKRSDGSVRDQPKTILLVEDEKVSRRIATKMLERAGFEVLVATNGYEAIDAFNENVESIKLILMDIQMPILGGLEATRQIRNTGKADNLPIIALSAGAMKGDRERGLENGMTDYLTKPVNYKVLVETLDQYLGASDGEVVG